MFEISEHGAAMNLEDVQPWLADLEQWLAAPWRDEAEVKAGLGLWVPEYRPATH